MAPEVIRVLVADDSSEFRRGLRALLASSDDVSVIDEAATGDEAAVRATHTQPDVVLMDLGMPGLNGIEATRRIQATSPHIAVLVLTMFEDDESVLAAMRAGAKGYLLKGAPRNEIIRALQVVAEGGVIFGPSVARRALLQFSGDRPHEGGAKSVDDAPFPQLSEREREILALIADGVDNLEIASRLTLSTKTVRNHVHNVYRKLQVRSRSEAIVQARDAGLGKPRGASSSS